MNISKCIRTGTLAALGVGLASGLAHAQMTGTQQQQRYETGQTSGQQQGWHQQQQQQFGQPVRQTHRASNLVGMDVRNFQQERIGRIEDLIVDPNTGQVAYAWLNANRILSGRETYVALPLTAFEPTPDQRALFVNLDRPRLQRMQTFRRDELPDLNDPAVQQAGGQVQYGADYRQQGQMQYDQYQTGMGAPGVRGQAQFGRDTQGAYQRDPMMDQGGRIGTGIGVQSRSDQYGFGQPAGQDQWTREQRWTDQRYMDQGRAGVGGQAQFDTGFRQDRDWRGTQQYDRFETRYDRQDTFSPRAGFEAQAGLRGPQYGYQYQDDRAYTGAPGADMQRGWAEGRVREAYRERMPEASVKGEIVAINPEEGTIAVSTEQGIMSFGIDEGVVLNAMGTRYPHLTDFRVGHGVEIGYQDDGFGRPKARTIIQTSGLATRGR